MKEYTCNFVNKVANNEIVRSPGILRHKSEPIFNSNLKNHTESYSPGDKNNIRNIITKKLDRSCSFSSIEDCKKNLPKSEVKIFQEKIMNDLQRATSSNHYR